MLLLCACVLLWNAIKIEAKKGVQEGGGGMTRLALTGEKKNHFPIVKLMSCLRHQNLQMEISSSYSYEENDEIVWFTSSPSRESRENKIDWKKTLDTSVRHSFEKM